MHVNGWPTYQMPYKSCRKLQAPEWGARALQTTDGRATAYSKREREFTLRSRSLKTEVDIVVDLHDVFGCC